MRSLNIHPVLAMALFFVINAVAANASPTIGTVNASPSVITLNTKTTVTITAKITDPSLISGSVNLLQLNGSGQYSIVGQLNDDGENGDAVAGDHIYTIQISLDEGVSTQLNYVVSAAFRGQLRRVLSSTIGISAWPASTVPAVGVTVNHPAEWGEQPLSEPDKANFSNVKTFSPITDASIANESLFQITRLPNVNPGLLPINKWFDTHFAAGFDTPPTSRTTVVVDGRNSVRITLSEIGPTVHIYVPDGPDVIEIYYDMNNPSFLVQYENMLSSLHIDPAPALKPTVAVSPFDNANQQDAVDVAILQIGKPYKSGVKGPDAFDCSGLVTYSYGQVGVKIPNGTKAQSQFGVPVSGAFQRGDLLFFWTNDENPGVLNHVGIAETSSAMIQAANEKYPVLRTFFDQTPNGQYWLKHFLFARRVSGITINHTGLTPEVDFDVTETGGSFNFQNSYSLGPNSSVDIPAPADMGTFTLTVHLNTDLTGPVDFGYDIKITQPGLTFTACSVGANAVPFSPTEVSGLLFGFGFNPRSVVCTMQK